MKESQANLSSLSFSHLIRFLEVAKELHFTRSAENLGIAQPLLSEQIKSLEHLTGAKLFNRTSRHVELTLAGKVFRDRVQLIVEGMRDSIVTARRVGSGKGASLRVGYTDEYSSDILPAVIRAMTAADPGVSLHLNFGMTPHLAELLQTGLIDAAFVCPIPEDPLGDEYQTMPLPPLPLSVALPRGHKLGERKKINIVALKNEPFIEGPASPLSASERVVNRLFLNNGVQRRIAQRAGDLELSISLVASGVGIMIAYFTDHSKKRNDISIVPLRETHATLTRALLWRSGNSAPLLGTLLDLLGRETKRK